MVIKDPLNWLTFDVKYCFCKFYNTLVIVTSTVLLFLSISSAEVPNLLPASTSSIGRSSVFLILLPFDSYFGSSSVAMLSSSIPVLLYTEGNFLPSSCVPSLLEALCILIKTYVRQFCTVFLHKGNDYKAKSLSRTILYKKGYRSWILSAVHKTFRPAT